MVHLGKYFLWHMRLSGRVAYDHVNVACEIICMEMKCFRSEKLTFRETIRKLLLHEIDN